MSIKESEAGGNNGRKKEDLFLAKPRWPSSRRSSSISSSSSSLSSSSNSSSSFRSSTHESSPPPSPEGGIPFSWETIPGIPKKQMILKHNDSSRKSNYLPLPPAATPVSHSPNKSTHKKHHISGTRRDPFFTALVECSKAGDGDGDDKAAFGWPKLSRNLTLGDRFGFGFASFSCKNAYAVAESVVFIPKMPRRIAYDKVKNRSG